MNVIQNKVKKLALSLLLGVVFVQRVCATEPSPPVLTEPSPPVSAEPSPPVSAEPSPPVSAEPASTILNSVVKVSGETRSGEKETALGFVVGQGFVVSSAALVKRWSRITVKLPNRGLELIAQNTIFDQQGQLALIRVDGVPAPAVKLLNPSLPFVISSDVFSVVIPVPTNTGPERMFKKGTLNNIEVTDGISMGKHNATISMAAAGGPLFDECGNVLGINLPLARRRGFRSGLVIIRDSVQAIHASHLKSFLQANNLEPVINNEACMTSAEKAAALQDEIDLRAAEADAATSQADEAAERAAAALQEEIDRREAEAAAARARAVKKEEQAKVLKLIAIAAGVVILIAMLAWVVWGARKNKALKVANRRVYQAEQEAFEASEASEAGIVRTATFDCLLEGEDAQGEPVVLKIPKTSLAEGRPAVIGRSPRNAEFVLDKENVSRAHTALVFSEGQLFAKDMMSTNGTKINGVPVSGSQQTPLHNGAVLEIGAIKFKVRFL